MTDAPPLIIAAPDTLARIDAWEEHLRGMRRLSPKTLEAYGRDVAQFLAFLTPHLGCFEITAQYYAAHRPMTARSSHRTVSCSTTSSRMPSGIGLVSVKEECGEDGIRHAG